MGILLFNWCGYRWVLNYMEQNANSRLVAKLDRHEYSDNELIEIRIPLHLPYLTSQEAFERCDGQVEVNGRHYNYVKRKIDNGELVLKCIPNESRQRLQSARDVFFSLVNDLQQEHPAKKTGDTNTSLSKNLAGDYDDQQPAVFVAAHYTAARPDYGVPAAASLSHRLKALPEQPPEA